MTVGARSLAMLTIFIDMNLINVWPQFFL
jgi:hypothetical protein